MKCESSAAAEHGNPPFPVKLERMGHPAVDGDGRFMRWLEGGDAFFYYQAVYVYVEGFA